MTQPIQLDAVDHKIIEHLRHHGRASNQQIAEGLGLTATTVSSRIKRMEEANMLRVVAVSKQGYELRYFNIESGDDEGSQ